MADENNKRWWLAADWWVVAGGVLCASLVVALWLFGPRATGTGAVASVNGVPVHLAARAPHDTAPGKHAARLQAAINNELWLQEGLRLDLAHSDPHVRAALLASVQDVALSGHPLTAPSEANLRAHFTAHKNRFARATGVHLQRILFTENGDSVKVAWQKAVDAYRRLNAGDDFPTVRQSLGDSDTLQLPDTVISSEALPALLGVDMTVSVLRLAAGQFSRPVEERGFIYIYRMLARDVPIVPSYADARPEVLVDYQRAARADALANYLARVRSRAHVVTY